MENSLDEVYFRYSKAIFDGRHEGGEKMSFLIHSLVVFFLVVFFFGCSFWLFFWLFFLVGGDLMTIRGAEMDGWVRISDVGSLCYCCFFGGKGGGGVCKHKRRIEP